MRRIYYIFRRLLAAVFVLWGMSLLTFTITHVIPSDPARLIAGNFASAEMVKNIRERLGLDKPLTEQYMIYFKRLVLEGDLGVSMHNFRPVKEDLIERIPASVELALFSMIITIPLAIIMGILSARRAGGIVDAVTRFGAIIGVSMPIFWTGLLLQLVFYGILKWFPSGARLSIGVSEPTHITGMYLLDSLITANWPVFKDALHHIILPALTLTLGDLAVLTRMTRASVLEILSQDYVRTARGKGLPESLVISRHVLRNAFIPIITIIGLQMAALIGWVFIVEIIYSWPGVGSYAVRAIMSFDFEPIIGFTLFMSMVYVIFNLLVDLTYVIIDPRVEY